MKKKILVVVDMQPRFEASNNPQTILNVIDLIRKAKMAGWPIIVLEFEARSEYDDYEQNTQRDIMKELLGSTYTVLEKDRDDGSQFVLAYRNRQPWRRINEFVVCGVNTDACVAETAWGLSDRGADKVEVIAPACNSSRRNWMFSDNQNVFYKDVA